MSIKKKASKGTVSVESFRGRLRLRFRVDCVQKTLAIGLDDTKENRIRASLIARQIEVDQIGGTFDHTLDKYRPNRKTLSSVNNLTAVELFNQYIQSKADGVSVTTLDKYKATLNQLKRYSSKLSVKSITSNEAKKFAAYLKPLYVPIVLKERIGLLRACWEWAKLPYNPWTDVRIKVPPIQPPKPFTPNEIRQILAQFKSQHYYSYVLFLFSTGCRTSEAIGLRWGHICGDRIWIGESLTKGVRKSTKTNRARTIPIPTTLKPHLIRPHNSGDDDLVFTTPTGCPIDDNNFCNRYWKPALEAAGVPYRRPYNTRHSFISNCLQQGLSPVEIASLTGHQLETLYTHYAGLVSKPQIPVLF